MRVGLGWMDGWRCSPMSLRWSCWREGGMAGWWKGSCFLFIFFNCDCNCDCYYGNIVDTYISSYLIQLSTTILANSLNARLQQIYRQRTRIVFQRLRLDFTLDSLRGDGREGGLLGHTTRTGTWSSTAQACVTTLVLLPSPTRRIQACSSLSSVDFSRSHTTTATTRQCSPPHHTSRHTRSPTTTTTHRPPAAPHTTITRIIITSSSSLSFYLHIHISSRWGFFPSYSSVDLISCRLSSSFIACLRASLWVSFSFCIMFEFVCLVN